MGIGKDDKIPFKNPWGSVKELAKRKTPDPSPKTLQDFTLPSAPGLLLIDTGLPVLPLQCQVQTISLDCAVMYSPNADISGLPGNLSYKVLV